MIKVKSAYGKTDPYLGIDFSDIPDMVVPDQGMSLREILDRFVRNEPLPVDMGGQFGNEDLDNPLNIDLEKMARADLTDKADYYNALEEIKKSYKAQEKAAENAKAEAARKAEIERIRAEALAENPPKPSA